ncbi:hypothetical protein VNI00_003690 [Paramarasmius palmivorus]|uniref:Glucose-methanol-choline oxidoreductase N-terminal domain-containing protein n=1 Tax=Paramarasmius palmivorus TaxID=297713 RepID=A0AAW0DUC3_9AGAR
MVALSTLLAVTSGFLSITCSSAKLLRSLPELNTTQYDFVIVGGGTAGSVLASRLTEDDRHTVLVVEAGVDNEGILAAEVPFLASTQFGTLVDWNYTTIPQPGANNQRLSAARGFALGGSSTLNMMVWYRGSNDLWDNFARLSGDDGWSWDSVSEYYMKASLLNFIMRFISSLGPYFQTSSLIIPQDGRNLTGEADPSAHGDGPVNVTLTPTPIDLDLAITDVAKESEGQLAYNLDYNSGDTLGIGWGQYSIGGGVRNSAATAYLQPAINRPNLDVLINTRVTKVLSSSPNKGSDPVIDVVQLASDFSEYYDTGPRINVTAGKEVILSAGSINTPQVLLLSGIGPENDLKDLNIPVVLDSPGVGANLTEHPLVLSVFSVNSTETFDDVLRNTTLAGELLEQWQRNKTGVYALSPGGSLVANWKLPEGFDDPSSGPQSANIMLAISDTFSGPNVPETGNFMTVLTAVVSPTSRGSLKLNTTNPFDSPLIDYAVYSTDFDIKAQVAGLNMVQEFFSSPPFEGIVQGLVGDLANATTDEAKAQYSRNNVGFYAHPTTSASMGPGGVVDASLKVKGVKGLRVVDASVFPQSPECNTQALVYVVAERAADLIKNEYK